MQTQGALWRSEFFVKEVKKMPYIHFTKEQKLRASKTDLPDDHEEPVQQLR